MHVLAVLVAVAVAVMDLLKWSCFQTIAWAVVFLLWLRFFQNVFDPVFFS